jgi:hypothetical protein
MFSNRRWRHVPQMQAMRIYHGTKAMGGELRTLCMDSKLFTTELHTSPGVLFIITVNRQADFTVTA